MKRSAVLTQEAPRPVGPYSQAIAVDGWVFVSGQIAIDPVSGGVIVDDIREATRRILRQMEAIVREAGGGLDDVVKTTVFLTNMEDFPSMNEVYAEFFKATPPARSTVEVAALPKGATVEIEAIAKVR